MKKIKLLLIAIILPLLTSCSSNEKKCSDSSTQINLSQEKTDITETTDQKEKVNIDYIYGEWQSIDEGKEYYMTIDKINDVTIIYSNNLKRNNSQKLIIEEATKDFVTDLIKDEQTRYNFSLLENGNLRAFMGVNSAYYSKKRRRNTCWSDRGS